MSRNGFRCFECDAKATHAHHIVPMVKGGNRTIPLCDKCHSKVHDLNLIKHSELTKAGIQKARDAGGNHGRPVIEVDFKKIKKLKAKGLKPRQIAEIINVSERTILRRIRGDREDT